MKVLILMAGPQKLKEISEPAALISHKGKTVIELYGEKIAKLPQVSDVIVIVKESDNIDFHLENILKLTFKDYKMLALAGPTKGAACSALMAIDEINNDEEILIISGDEYCDIDYNDAINFYRQKNSSGGVLSFDSIHPSYSYALQADNGDVEMVTEKNPISRCALVGLWYFKHGSDFVKGAQNTIRKDASVRNAYFVSPVLNELILAGKKVSLFKIDQKDYYPFKSDHQVKDFLSEF